MAEPTILEKYHTLLAEELRARGVEDTIKARKGIVREIVYSDREALEGRERMQKIWDIILGGKDAKI